MQRLSSLEFTYWQRVYAEDPFGSDVENFRMGQICATLVNLTRGKDEKKVTPGEFYPHPKKSRPELTQRQREQLEKKRGRRTRGKISD